MPAGQDYDLMGLVWFLNGATQKRLEAEHRSVISTARMDHGSVDLAKTTYAAVKHIVARHRAQLLIHLRLIDCQVVVELHDRWLSVLTLRHGAQCLYFQSDPRERLPANAIAIPKNVLYLQALRNGIRPSLVSQQPASCAAQRPDIYPELA